MGIQKYYQKWILQESTGNEREVLGIFRQDQSSETRIAAGQGINSHGRFAYEPNESLNHGDVLRCGNLFIRLEGDLQKSPKFAITQIKTFYAITISRQ